MKLDFALTQEKYDSAMALLFGPDWYRPRDPERGFLAALHAGAGLERRTLILGGIIDPLPGEVQWSPTRGLIMSHRYYSRAIDHVQAIAGTGLINVHSHPGPRVASSPPLPSTQDLESDRNELGAVFRALSPGRPMAAAIFSAGGRISVREYTFKRPSTREEALRFERRGPTIRFVDRIRIVGRRLRFQEGDPHRTDQPRAFDPVCTDSSVLLWGERGQRLLAEITVGIAGLGGVGGMVAEYLARLGVGRLVLVDYDRLELENFNRSQGATRNEATRRALKVEVYRRITRASATAPQFKSVARRASVAEEEGLRQLLDCDLIIGSADDAMARQVLDHASYAHLIPVIDGGTVLLPQANSMMIAAGKSQIASAGPGHPCLECQGVYTQEEATIARETASWGQYVGAASMSAELGKELRSPSVICTNGLVASLIVLRILSVVLGITPAAISGLQRYYIESGEVHWGAIKECKPGCRKSSFMGQGDSHFIPTGMDLRWKSVRDAEGTLVG